MAEEESSEMSSKKDKYYESFKAEFYAPGKQEEINKIVQRNKDRFAKNLDILIKELQLFSSFERDVRELTGIISNRDVYKEFDEIDTELWHLGIEVSEDSGRLDYWSQNFGHLRKDLQENPSGYFTPEEMEKYIPELRNVHALIRIQMVFFDRLQAILRCYWDIHQQTLEDLSIALGYEVTIEDLLSPNFKEVVLDKINSKELKIK